MSIIKTRIADRKKIMNETRASTDDFMSEIFNSRLQQDAQLITQNQWKNNTYGEEQPLDPCNLNIRYMLYLWQEVEAKYDSVQDADTEDKYASPYYHNRRIKSNKRMAIHAAWTFMNHNHAKLGQFINPQQWNQWKQYQETCGLDK